MMPAHVRDIAVHGTRWRVYRALSGHEDRCHRTLSIITRQQRSPSPKALSRTLCREACVGHRFGAPETGNATSGPAGEGMARCC
jgi:hypothetical protein